MTRIPPSAGGVPKVLYTFENHNGDRLALAIRKNLDEVPNRGYIKPPMLHPRTPDAVRTLLYNELANRVRVRMYERLTMATKVLLHTLPNGDSFFEVQLTDQGRKYLEDYYTNESHYYTFTSYDHYDPSGIGAKQLFKVFQPPLREALTFIGMRPN